MPPFERYFGFVEIPLADGEPALIDEILTPDSSRFRPGPVCRISGLKFKALQLTFTING